jgi:hypothetical protein
MLFILVHLVNSDLILFIALNKSHLLMVRRCEHFFVLGFFCKFGWKDFALDVVIWSDV